MLETILPYVAKYNLQVNTQFKENDYVHIGNALANGSGTVIIVWEHKYIGSIINYLGVTNLPRWKDNDFDSVWVITFQKGKAVLKVDKEDINPGDKCSF